MSESETKYPVPPEILKMDVLMGTNYVEKWEIGLYRPVFREGWKAFFDGKDNSVPSPYQSANTEWEEGWKSASEFMDRYRRT